MDVKGMANQVRLGRTTRLAEVTGTIKNQITNVLDTKYVNREAQKCTSPEDALLRGRRLVDLQLRDVLGDEGLSRLQKIIEKGEA